MSVFIAIAAWVLGSVLLGLSLGLILRFSANCGRVEERLIKFLETSCRRRLTR